MARSLKPNWSFFSVPVLSRTGQSFQVWGGKLVNGWPLVLRNAFALVERFGFGRMRVLK